MTWGRMEEDIIYRGRNVAKDIANSFKNPPSHERTHNLECTHCEEKLLKLKLSSSTCTLNTNLESTDDNETLQKKKKNDNSREHEVFFKKRLFTTSLLLFYYWQTPCLVFLNTQFHSLNLYTSIFSIFS